MDPRESRQYKARLAELFTDLTRFLVVLEALARRRADGSLELTETAAAELSTLYARIRAGCVAEFQVSSTRFPVVEYQVVSPDAPGPLSTTWQMIQGGLGSEASKMLESERASAPRFQVGDGITLDAVDRLLRAHRYVQAHLPPELLGDFAIMQGAIERLGSGHANSRTSQRSGVDAPSALQTAEIGSAETVDGSSSIEHGDDFTWIVSGAARYEFKKGQQAAVIKALFESWVRSGRRDGSGLGEETLADRASASSRTDFRVRRLFKGNRALDRILKSPAKGQWALYLTAQPGTPVRKNPT